MSAAEEALDEHQKRDEAADLLATIERVREQQKRLRERLGAVIAKRTSLENVLAELHRFQVEAEQAMAGMEADKGGDTLDMSVRNFLEFAREAHSRCNGIEGSLQGILQQEKEFAEVKTRLAPLIDVESGVRKRLRLLHELRSELVGSLEAIERDGGIPLADRVKELAESRSGLAERISELKVRCEEIEQAFELMIQQQKEFDAIRTRLAPVLDAQNGVRTRLRILQDTRAELVGSLETVERDGGIPLPERVQQLAETRSGLEQRVSALLDQVEKIETVQKEISALFAKLNQANRVSRDMDGSIRIVSQTG